jgi:hypothetical protein
LGEFLAGAIALTPSLDDFAQLGQSATNMMIYHRFMGQDGHFELLYLIFDRNICALEASYKRHFVPLRMK